MNLGSVQGVNVARQQDVWFELSHTKDRVGTHPFVDDEGDRVGGVALVHEKGERTSGLTVG